MLAFPLTIPALVVGVAYDSDVDRVASLLVEAASAQPRVLADPAPSAALSAFGADALEFTLSYWIADPEAGTLGLKSDINRTILAAFRAQGIEIPYPQRVLHVTGAKPAAATAPIVQA